MAGTNKPVVLMHSLLPSPHMESGNEGLLILEADTQIQICGDIQMEEPGQPRAGLESHVCGEEIDSSLPSYLYFSSIANICTSWQTGD